MLDGPPAGRANASRQAMRHIADARAQALEPNVGAAQDNVRIGFMLLASEEKSSALRGMEINKALRGRGLSKVLLAIWLQACISAGLTPRTRTINKPLLSLTLQRFGFSPRNRRAQRIEVGRADNTGNILPWKIKKLVATDNLGSSDRDEGEKTTNCQCSKR